MFWLLIVAQLIMGVAQAGVFPAACNSIGQWMPLAQRTLGCGVFTAGMQIGAIIASWSVGVLILEFDWRWIFVAFSMPGILWALGFVSWFRERPELTPAVNLQELELIRAGRDTRDVNANDVNPPVADDDWAGLLKIARRPSMLWLCGQQICRASGYMFLPVGFRRFCRRRVMFLSQSLVIGKGLCLPAL